MVFDLVVVKYKRNINISIHLVDKIMNHQNKTKEWANDLGLDFTVQKYTVKILEEYTGVHRLHVRGANKIID